MTLTCHGAGGDIERTLAAVAEAKGDNPRRIQLFERSELLNLLGSSPFARLTAAMCSEQSSAGTMACLPRTVICFSCLPAAKTN